jgi:ABC-type transport system involved in multi-copper enzyme maturation permease subunit
VSLGAFWALVWGTWREWLSRPVVPIVMLVVCASQVATAVLVRDLQDPALFLTLVIGSGSVGRDVSSGVLPLIFTRPVVRSYYLLGKWLAVGSGVAVVSAATVLVQAAWLAHRGTSVPGAEVGEMLVDTTTTAFGIASVLIFLSTLVSGMGDLGIWIILNIGSSFAHKFLSLRGAEEVKALVHPHLAWSSSFGAAPIAWLPILSYLSTVTLWLCVAALAINRKELSYASG